MTGPGADEDGPTPVDPLADDRPQPPPARPGASTFTIEGRQAPALFVIGWLASIMGLVLAVVGAMASGGALWLIVLGLVVLSIGLVAAAGSQGMERRARGGSPYVGPSPLLVFAACVPVSLVALVLVGLPLVAVGVDVQGPIGRAASITVQTLVYAALIRLLVVDTGALSWAEMGLRRLDLRAVGDVFGGALWALPVIAVTVPVSAVLVQLFGVAPESPLPPTGETSSFVLQLIAGALIAPLGEELLFRGLATTAWVRTLGPWRGVIRAALVFAFAHVIGVAGSTFGESAGLAVVAFGARMPVAIALGWLFVRRGSLWSSFGLHAAYNGILLIVAEVGARALASR